MPDKTTKSNHSAEIVQLDMLHLKGGQYEREETPTQVILRYLKQNSNKDGTNQTPREIIDQSLEHLVLHGGKLKKTDSEKKIYRKRSELPNPDKKADAEVNRLRKMFGVRVLPEIRDAVDEAAKEAGMTRQDWVEMALMDALDRQKP